MGKENLVQIPTSSRAPSSSRLRAFVVTFLLAAGLWIFAFSDILIHEESESAVRYQASSSITKEFEWNRALDPFSGTWPAWTNNCKQLSPKTKLHWVPCYTGFQCARLQVPLDYEDPGAGNAAIALLRYPAKVGRGQSEYKGPILFNPGGPGGSGVSIILRYGPRLQSVLGNDYDMVGFDPRGIGHTTPVVDVFNNPLERKAWELRNADAPFVNETKSALVELVAKARLIADLVAKNVPTAAAHVNTAVVCRDMLSIIQAHGQDKLQYWGFSYGSVLGASFAALFPDNVGRLVIDGVVDADNYYAGLWDSNLRVADKGLETIFKQCVQSGKHCPLHESTVDKVKDRYLHILDSLEEKPITVLKGNSMNVITKRVVRATFFAVLYRPYRAAKPFFAALRALEDGNGLPLYEMGIGDGPDGGPLKCDCGSNPPLPIGGAESGVAVMCSDAGPVDYNLEEFQRHFEKLAKESYFGDIWSQIRLECVGRKVKAKNPWNGPVTGNTSFPLLLVGNTEDPVTPDAQKMSHAFKDSVVLTQLSAGHCSLAAASLCTAKAIRAYFRDGTLPAKGIKCDIEDHMFLNVTTTALTSMSIEDARILESVRGISEEIRFDRLLPTL